MGTGILRFCDPVAWLGHMPVIPFPLLISSQTPQEDAIMDEGEEEDTKEEEEEEEEEEGKKAAPKKKKRTPSATEP